VKRALLNQALIEQLGLANQLTFPIPSPLNYFARVWPELRLTPQQTHILQVWGDILARRVPQKHLLIGSGHGLGKTLLMGRMAYYFVDARKDRDSTAKALTTAPTNRQVLDLLWEEIRSAIPADWVGDLTPKSASMTWPDGRWLRGFSTHTTEQFQGYHERYLGVFMDEGPGIESRIWQAIETCCVAEHNHIVVIGNPVAPSDEFAQRVGDPHWMYLNLSCLDHPNVVTGDDSLYPKMVTRAWVEEQLRRHSWPGPEGESPPAEERNQWIEFGGRWWRLTNYILGRVCGLIPVDAEDQLIQSAWVRRAFENWRNGVRSEDGPVVVGCDVARYGDDRTVIMVRRGQTLRCAWKRQGRSTVEVAHKLAEIASQEQAQAVAVDDTGVGGGVTDLVRTLLPRGCQLHPVILGGGAWQKQRYLNARSELFFTLKSWLERPDIAVEPTDEFGQDVTAPTYRFDGSVFRLEAKEHLKARLKRSPDEGDAAALCMILDVGRPQSQFAFASLSGGPGIGKSIRDQIIATARTQAEALYPVERVNPSVSQEQRLTGSRFAWGSG
jgi:hypothetical protein